MKSPYHIIMFLSFIMIGIVTGTMICNYQYFSRFSMETNQVAQVPVSQPAVSGGSQVVVSEGLSLPDDVVLDHSAITPMALPAVLDVTDTPAETPAPTTRALELPPDVFVIPEASQEDAVSENDEAENDSSALSLDLPSLLDLPVLSDTSSDSVADADEMAKLLNFDTPPAVAEQSPEIDPAAALAATLHTPSAPAYEPAPAPVAQLPREVPAAVLAQSHAQPKRTVSPENIYVSPWDSQDGQPQPQVSHVAGSVGSRLDNPLRSRPSVEPAQPMLAVSPVVEPAPLSEPVREPVHESPQVVAVQPAAAPVVETDGEPKLSLPPEGLQLTSQATNRSTSLPASLPDSEQVSGVPSVGTQAGLPATLPLELSLTNAAASASPEDVSPGAGPVAVENITMAGDAMSKRKIDFFSREGVLVDPVVLQTRQMDIRRLIRQVQEKTGLTIYVSVEVQGEYACDIRTRDVDEVFRRLLGATPYDFVREGLFVYIGRRNDVRSLSVNVAEMGGRRVTPLNLSLDACQRFITGQLTTQGRCSRQEIDGEQCLIVMDMELALMEMDRMLEVLDVPIVNQRLDAFVFERHSTDKKYLDLPELADNAGVIIQEYGKEDEKKKQPEAKSKGLFEDLVSANAKKNEDKSKNCRTYTLSHRIDSLLMALEDRDDITLITQRKGVSHILDDALLARKPLTYPFTLGFGEEKVEHLAKVVVTTTEAKNSADDSVSDVDAGHEMMLKVECRPTREVKKAARSVKMGKAIHFSAPISLNHALVFQGKAGDFSDDSDIVKKMAMTRKYVEMIVVLVVREDEFQVPRTELTNAAVKYMIRRCEELSLEIAQSESKGDYAENLAMEFHRTAKNLRHVRNTAVR